MFAKTREQIEGKPNTNEARDRGQRWGTGTSHGTGSGEGQSYRPRGKSIKSWKHFEPNITSVKEIVRLRWSYITSFGLQLI